MFVVQTIANMVGFLQPDISIPDAYILSHTCMLYTPGGMGHGFSGKLVPEKGRLNEAKGTLTGKLIYES